MGGLAPGLGPVSGYPCLIERERDRVALGGGMSALARFVGSGSWGGEQDLVVPVRCVLLTESTRGRLRVLGVNLFAGVHYTWIPDGDSQGNLSLGQHTGDGKSDGETFLGRTWMFFLGGRGGKRKRQGMVSRVGRWTTRVFKQSHFVIYYMLISGGFTAVCLQDITKGVLDPR
jgi:hypothetical protein